MKPPLRTMPKMYSSTQKIPDKVPMNMANLLSKENFPDLSKSKRASSGLNKSKKQKK